MRAFTSSPPALHAVLSSVFRTTCVFIVTGGGIAKSRINRTTHKKVEVVMASAPMQAA